MNKIDKIEIKNKIREAIIDILDTNFLEVYDERVRDGYLETELKGHKNIAEREVDRVAKFLNVS